MAPSLSGAGNGTRTRDIHLGKVVLYQLSYSRISFIVRTKNNTPGRVKVKPEIMSP